MIENIDDYLTGLVLGVRFHPNFHVCDNFGTIIDDILYSKDSFFNHEIFPSIMTTNDYKLILQNEKTKNQLQITPTDFILIIDIDGSVFTASDIDVIKTNYESQIINGLLSPLGIKKIKLVGYIKKYSFDLENLAKKFIENSFSNSISDISELYLRFTKKKPLGGSLVKPGVSDFDNIIHIVERKAQNDDLSVCNDLLMSIDYQRRFLPFLQHSNKIRYSDFLRDSEHFNSSSIKKWINTYLGDE